MWLKIWSSPQNGGLEGSITYRFGFGAEKATGLRPQQVSVSLSTTTYEYGNVCLVAYTMNKSEIEGLGK